MKKNIAIITGGDSSEEVISLKSAGQVRQHLDDPAYRTFLVYIKGDDWHVKLDDPESSGSLPSNQANNLDEEQPDDRPNKKLPIDRNNFSFRLKDQEIRFDFAFIAMHGPPGENGKLQAYFDLIGIPYSSAGMLALALSFDKYACKQFLKQHGILTAESLLIKTGSAGEAATIDTDPDETDPVDPAKIIRQVGLPCFVKPNEGGSSFGISRVDKAEALEAAIEKARKEDGNVLIESFIPGSELTSGVLKLSSREFLFPVTEVISKNDFFDYEAKYTEGMAEEITPAIIPEALAEDCRKTASKIYDLLGCRGLVRIDFINSEGQLYFLELNGIPGMSRESIIPKQIRTMGHTEAEIYRLIVEDHLIS